jgi:hypothetical protein
MLPAKRAPTTPAANFGGTVASRRLAVVTGVLLGVVVDGGFVTIAALANSACNAGPAAGAGAERSAPRAATTSATGPLRSWFGGVGVITVR